MEKLKLFSALRQVIR